MAVRLFQRDVFDRETILDITVNLVPLAILAIFVLYFLVVTPWERNLFATFWMVVLHLVPFVLLAILTYVSAVAIESDQRGRSEEEAPPSRRE